MKSRNLHIISLAFAAVLLLTGCKNAVFDYDAECREGLDLRFVYDYNLEWANSFHKKVHCLTVLFYDEEGNLVERRSETSEALADPDYHMTVDLKPGKYFVAAYGGMECDKAHFAFENDPAAINRQDRTVALAAAKLENEEYQSNTELHDHFHGMLEIDVKEESFEYTVGTVEMMKNTNNFRVIVKNVNGNPLTHDMFRMKITDDNTRFAYNNALLPADRTVTYRHWVEGEVGEGVYDEDGKEITNAFAEISTSRLITRATKAGAPSGASSIDDPRLIIERTDGSGEALNVPLIWILSQMASSKYSNPDAPEFMPGGLQEFLDRKSQWDIMVIVDDSLDWVSIHIKVDSWTVRLNRVDFH